MSRGQDWGETNPNWRGGKASHELYDIYNDMVARCRRPTHLRYAAYGGRGITVCDRWANDFWAFVEDMGPRPPGRTAGDRPLYSLDRIDNDAGYEPANCRWATWLEQRHNRRPVLNPNIDHDPVTGRFVSAMSS